MTALELAVDALAAFRLTRLVTRDKITEPARDDLIEEAYAQARRTPADADLPDPVHAGDWTAIAHEDPDVPKVAAFIVCPWCVGMYVAAGVTLARRYVPGWEHLARLLAVSAATGLLAAQE